MNHRASNLASALIPQDSGKIGLERFSSAKESLEVSSNLLRV